MNSKYADLGAAINGLDFDHPFRIVDGAVIDAPTGIYAPDVYHDETTDVEIHGDGWRCLTGMTGQYGYNGAVMHPSEFIGAGIAERLVELSDDASEDGRTVTFAAVVVRDLDADRDNGEDDGVGWAIVYRED